MRLTVVVDNVAAREGLQARHGLSMHIRQGEWQVLFDTDTEPDAVRANAARLDLDLAAVRAVVLSHGHFDHTGGLGVVADVPVPVQVYAHPDALGWKGRANSERSLGPPWSLDRLSEWQAEFHGVEGPREVLPGLIVSGSIPGPAGFAQAGFTAVLDGQLGADPFRDEVFAIVQADAGPVIVTGCCHRGVANTLAYAQTITGLETFAGLVGGLHLGHADESDLAAVADVLARTITGPIRVNHCTGVVAADFLQGVLGAERVRYLGAGEILEL